MQQETQLHWRPQSFEDPATRGYSRAPIRSLGTILDHAEAIAASRAQIDGAGWSSRGVQTQLASPSFYPGMTTIAYRDGGLDALGRYERDGRGAPRHGEAQPVGASQQQRSPVLSSWDERNI